MSKETTLTDTPAAIQERVRKMQAMGGKQVAVAGEECESREFATHVIQELR
jgi:hypothetical protein